jgi:hypothetical protein
MHQSAEQRAASVLAVIAEIDAIPATMFADLHQQAGDSSLPLDSMALDTRRYPDLVRDLLVEHSPWHGSEQDRAAQALLDAEVRSLVVAGLVRMAKAYIHRRRAPALP